MAKKKSRTALSVFATASRSEASEAIYFARKCGLTPDEALRIMREAHVTSGFKSPDNGKQKR
ncbi:MULTISPECIES: hypothetical protein [unclassified Mesorhizobium]|uniref:hypothetical protein n=1 Tax=unclassified Mesorhizobium TaxID=325217 RepID=UPI000F74E3AE|nr:MULTISPECIES: hypothetical protein [unclassified Mesorhizobium]AZO24429.1 hypothetical protein EJ070_29565 [Mesorhizobium sp. M1E.F.Ca.ET.045.02.1.1]RUW29245.1 hypothetical protein EOA38_23560 [Mesorhizobium sp. M1E.F.Ca.ET.041.01.1.1]RUW83365.1 hypothetical protein EOA29_13700 [Mesorhizobium sp. M1E.F.Ca.ET.063.01.1.1]RWB50956.1 MAG: hypothetical protein EOQ47_31570 [Mesorhizobium sp.]RWD79841.1 MAG: hypothetical protein EOS38_30995 [Mesorhizobium sp.]